MNKIIEKLGKAILNKRREVYKNTNLDPKLKVVFSPEGLAKCRAESASVMYFECMNNNETVCGCPFEVDRDAHELFEVVEI